MKIIILVLVGVPGIGKTTFARYLGEESSLRDFTFIHICYDKLLPPSSWTTPELCEWKRHRQKLFDDVHCLVRGLTKKEEKCPDNLIEFQERAVHSQKPVVIIIDDNMYYRSMRYSYYRLAKEYSISFCQIYFEANIEKALDHNLKRTDSVPLHVFKKISDNLEPPSSLIPWEKFFLVIPAYGEQNLILKNVTQLLETSLLNPEVPPETKEPCIHSPNVVHLMDLAIRKLISHKVSLARASLKGDEFRKFNEDLIEKKKTILCDMRKGLVWLPDEVNNEINLTIILPIAKTLIDR